jgi:hypothetical protein
LQPSRVFNDSFTTFPLASIRTLQVFVSCRSRSLYANILSSFVSERMGAMATSAKPTTKLLLGITMLLLLCVTGFVAVDAVGEASVLHRRILQYYSTCAGGKFPGGCDASQSCYDGHTCTSATSCCSQCQPSKSGGKKCCGSLGGISCLAV